MKLQYDKVNSWLVSLFLFQFSILLPLALLFDIGIAYVVSTTILLIISLINNKFQFNPLFILIFVIIITYMLINFLYHRVDFEIILMIFSGFIAKGISALYITSNKIDFNYLYKSLMILSWINLIVLTIFLLLFNLDENVSYMRLGYAIVPSTIILLGEILLFKFNILKFLGFLLSIILLLLYGNRGVFIVILLFVILLVLFIYNKNIKTFLGILIFGIIVYIVAVFNLLSKIILFLYNEVGIYSYSLMKFSLSIEEGIVSSSSGRDYLYIEGLNRFLDNPLLGNGIGHTFEYTTTTAHNFVLQILIESGMIGLFTIVLISIYIVIRLIRIKDTFFRISVVFLTSISMGRLLVSSDIWLRPELWMMLGIIVSIFNFQDKIDR